MNLLGHAAWLAAWIFFSLTCFRLGAQTTLPAVADAELFAAQLRDSASRGAAEERILAMEQNAPDLLHRLYDAHGDLRANVVGIALRLRVRAPATRATTLRLLVRAIFDGIPQLRESAFREIRATGVEAHTALPELRRALETPALADDALMTMAVVAGACQDASEQLSMTDLLAATACLEATLEHLRITNAEQWTAGMEAVELRRAARALRDRLTIRTAGVTARDVLVLLRDRPALALTAIGTLAVLLWIAALCWLPFFANRVDAALASMPVNPALRGTLRLGMLVSVFAHRPSTLNAWVRRRAAQAFHTAHHLRVAQGHMLHIPSPFEIDGRAVDRLLLLTDLRQGSTLRIAVVGPAGCGKTNLLHRQVEAISERTQATPAIPLFLGARASPVPTGQSFVAVVANALHLAVGTSSPPTVTLVQQLLSTGRVVLVIDGLDELPTHVRENLLAEIDSTPVAAVIVTSRTVPAHGTTPWTVVRPGMLGSAATRDFLHAVLDEHLELFRPHEIHDHAQWLNFHRDQQPVPALLVRLLADRLVDVASAGQQSREARSLDRLVGDFLAKLAGNGIAERPRALVRAARNLAHECFPVDSAPRSISWRQAVAGLDPMAADDLIVELIESLALLYVTEVAANTIAFRHTMIGRVLAAQWLVEHHGDDLVAWRELCAVWRGLLQVGGVVAMPLRLVSAVIDVLDNRGHVAPRRLVQDVADLALGYEADL